MTLVVFLFHFVIASYSVRVADHSVIIPYTSRSFITPSFRLDIVISYLILKPIYDLLFVIVFEQVWDYDDGVVTDVGEGHSGPITRVRMCPNLHYVVSVSADGAILIWKYPHPERS